MMTLFCLLAGIAAITLIARYNESESLFWKLFICYVGSWAAVNAAVEIINNDKKGGKVVMIEKAPMQVLESVPSLNAILADMSLAATTREKSPKPASKELCSFNQNNVISSEVHRKARGQPQWYMYFSDS